jgi:hypothetical protein
VRNSTNPEIESKLCAKIEKNPKNDEILKLECISEDNSTFQGD